jgi:hypothetical protein
MSCCPDFDRILDRDLARNAQPYQLTNGTIITDIDTEFFLEIGRASCRERVCAYV